MIDFTGGEPLLYDALPEVLSYAKKLGFFVKLSTNGLIYSQRAEEIKGQVDRIYFSLDAASREEYRRIRGVDGFEDVINSVKTAQRLHEQCCLVYTVTNENIGNIPAMIEFCQQQKIPVLFHPCFSYFQNPALDSHHIQTIKKYFTQSFVRMSLPYLNFYQQGGNDPLHTFCKAGASTLDITPDNRLPIPCFLKKHKEISINGNLYSILRSEKWKTLIEQAGTYDFCHHCTFECYFGLSYWGKLFGGKYLLQQTLSYLNDIVEQFRYTSSL